MKTTENIKRFVNEVSLKCMTVMTAAILFAGTEVSQAQVSFSIGPKGGLSSSSFSGDSAGTVTANTSWAAGAFMNFHFLKFLAIQPELLIHQKGASQKIGMRTNEIKLNYFEVPVLLKLMVPVDNHIYPHVLVGPSFSYRMGGTFKATNTESGTIVNFNEGDLKKYDTGGILGVGVDFETDHLYINLDGRYGFGFSDIGENSVKLKNRNWTAMLGIGYRFGTPTDRVIVKEKVVDTK